MNWPKKILVPFDGSGAAQEAFKAALAFARGGGSLRGLFVMDSKVIRAHHYQELAALSGIGPNPDLERRTRESMQELGKDLLAYFERACAKAKVPCDTVLSEAAVTDGILAASSGTGLIAMGRRGIYGRGLLGTNADRVARHADVPVLIVPGKAGPLKKIAVACDNSPSEAKTLALAEKAAEALGASLTLVHAADDEMAAGAVLEKARKRLKRPAKTLFLRGTAAEAIPVLAHDKLYDLIVMGAYGHGYLREFLLGSVTDLVLRETQTPLLIQR